MRMNDRSLTPEVLALARKAGEAIGECARTSYQRGYLDGFVAGMRHAENHSFRLPDIEPELSIPDPEVPTTSVKHSVRPDAEAEHLRASMLDLDPYEPITPREDTP